MTSRAVILAAGRGRRMRRPEPDAVLTGEQRDLADRGLKALVPIAGSPFLDRQLAALAAIGIERVCVVVGADHAVLVAHCAARAAGEPAVVTAVQRRPRGTADALLAAEAFAGAEPFLALNSDNLYPAPDLARLGALPGPGLLAVERRRARADGLADTKLRAWAVVGRDPAGDLVDLVEKPGDELWRRLPEPVLLSTNAWRFGPEIFAACRAVAPSIRGELELPAAALLMARAGRPPRVLVAEGAVLDLSERRDVAALEARWRTTGSDP